MFPAFDGKLSASCKNVKHILKMMDNLAGFYGIFRDREPGKN